MFLKLSHRARFSAYVLLLILISTAISAALTLPTLNGRVVDDAGLLTPEERTAISARLETHEKETSNQIVVVTVPDLQGYDIAEFALQIGREWGIGQKDKDNGVVLLVAPSERKARIEVGYGLEGDLTDAASHNIIQKEILPAFRDGDFSAGIASGVNAIVGTIQGTYSPPASSDESHEHYVPLFFLVLFAIPHLLSRFISKKVANRAVVGGFAGFAAFIGTKSILIALAVGAAATLLVVLLRPNFGDSRGTGRSATTLGNEGSFGSSGGFGSGGFGGGGGGFGGGGASGGW